MPSRARPAHTEAFSEIRQPCLFKEQVLYELWRPVVLFGATPAERAAETGASESTIRRQTAQFARESMPAVFHPMQRQQVDEHRALLPPIRQEIGTLETQYPPYGILKSSQTRNRIHV